MGLGGWGWVGLQVGLGGAGWGWVAKCCRRRRAADRGALAIAPSRAPAPPAPLAAPRPGRRPLARTAPAVAACVQWGPLRAVQQRPRPREPDLGRALCRRERGAERKSRRCREQCQLGRASKADDIGIFGCRNVADDCLGLPLVPPECPRGAGTRAPSMHLDGSPSIAWMAWRRGSRAALLRAIRVSACRRSTHMRQISPSSSGSPGGQGLPFPRRLPRGSPCGCSDPNARAHWCVGAPQVLRRLSCPFQPAHRCGCNAQCGHTPRPEALPVS